MIIFNSGFGPNLWAELVHTDVKHILFHYTCIYEFSIRPHLNETHVFLSHSKIHVCLKALKMQSIKILQTPTSFDGKLIILWLIINLQMLYSIPNWQCYYLLCIKELHAH